MAHTAETRGLKQMSSTPIVQDLHAHASSDTFLDDLFWTPAPRDTTEDRARFVEAVRRFYSCSLDEARLRRAHELAQCILEINQDGGANRLRLAVQRRELGQTTHHPGQRDHLTHTISSYLLGWRIYDASKTYRDALDNALKPRLVEGPDYPRQRAFRSLWSPASLLHDVGYIFEGGLQLRSDEQSFAHAKLAADTVNDLTRSWAYLPKGLQSQATIDWLTNYALRTFNEGSALENRYRIQTGTLLETATTLANVGPLPAFSRAVEQGLLPTNTFDLWRQHHEDFGASRIANSIASLKDTYIKYVTDGLPNAGVRIIDHGTASGLIMTMVDTFYYELKYTAIHAADARAPGCPQAVKDYAIAHKDPTPTAYTQAAGFTHWAWNMWSASAAALHNIAQSAPAELFGGPLALSDDPIAYLGILVDELQEWDRHTVSRNSAYEGEVPIQASEVFISVDDSKVPPVALTFNIEPDQKAHWEKREKKKRETLDRALADWGKLVSINTHYR
jgi:hypothetical protein